MTREIKPIRIEKPQDLKYFSETKVIKSTRDIEAQEEEEGDYSVLETDEEE